MKRILRNICYVATGINVMILSLAIYLNDLDLLLLSGSSATLTLFGAMFAFSEDK